MDLQAFLGELIWFVPLLGEGKQFHSSALWQLYQILYLSLGCFEIIP
jgi:hypothetical protein